MNYIKSFWTSEATTSSDSSQQQAINTVTFATPTSGNSFIITTSQSPQRPQPVIFHTGSSSLRPEMAVSPTDSFHSTSSTFDQSIEKKKEKKIKGNVNNGFTASTPEINTTQHHHHHHHHHSNNQ